MINKIKNNKREYILAGLLFIFIFLTANASAKLAFDNDCPASSVNNVNFSNGTAIFLPFTYNETNTTSSNLTIFLGTNTDYFCSSINENLSTFSANRTVIFTPEFFNALKTSSCNSTFENYMNNYRKSGNILNSSGTVFCGIKNITFAAATNPSGVTFNYSYLGNISIPETHYNNADLKKYMIAYLMNNPNAELSGIVSTFANAIGVNLSSACSDASSISSFFNSGKGNYTANFKPQLLGINWTAGEQLKPSQGTGGIFGWLLGYVLGNKTLPIITAANLSSNKIYVCGVVTLSNALTNSTVTITTNTTTIDATSSVNTTLEITTNASVTNATIELVTYPENPQSSGAAGVTALNKYVGIRMDNALKNVLSSVIIKVYYTDAEVSDAGVQESTLRIYYYNETSSSWQIYDSPNGGVDTTANYVWANTTHFSNWGIFGTPSVSSRRKHHEVISETNATCTVSLSCADWSVCMNRMQTRTCNDTGTCNSGITMESRNCIVLPIIPVTVPTSTPVKIELAGPAITGNAVSNLSKVPLRIGWFSIISVLIVIGIISWAVIIRQRKKIGKKK